MREWVLPLGLAAYLVLSFRTVYDLYLLPRAILQPWLMNNGFMVYRDIVDQHEAGMPILLALLLPVVGSALLLDKWMLIGLVVATLLAVRVVSVRVSGDWRVGALSALFFTLWAPVVFRGMLWYEVFLGLLYVVAYGLWPASLDGAPRRVFVAGLALGLATVFKQYAWAVVAAYLGWTIVQAVTSKLPLRSWVRVVSPFGVGVALVFGCYVTYLVASGALPDYLRWAWLNNVSYSGQARQLPTLSDAPALVALALPVAALGLTRPRGREDLFLVLVSLAAACTAFPRYELFHLIGALPLTSVALGGSVAVLLGASGASASRRPGPDGEAGRPSWASRLPSLIGVLSVGIAAVWVLVPAYRGLIHPGPQHLHYYSELLGIAERAATYTGPDERILVFPADEYSANTYYLSRRLPTKPWAYTYPWYMTDEVMASTIATLDAEHTRVVVYFDGLGVDGRPAEEYARPVAQYIDEKYESRETVGLESGTARIMVRKPG